MTSVNRIPPAHGPAEGDLFSIIAGVWRQRKLVIGIAFATAACALAYGFLATPEYRVTGAIRAIGTNELDLLNRSGVYLLTPEEAQRRVGASLESYDTRLGFFRSHPDLFKSFGFHGQSIEQGFEEFNKKSLVLSANVPDALGNPIELDLTYKAGVDGVAILNGLLEYAHNLERTKIEQGVGTVIKNRLNEIQSKIDGARLAYSSEKSLQITSLEEQDALKRSLLQDELRALRSQLKVLRADRIAQLDEALAIAHRLGIQKPSTFSSLSTPTTTGSVSVVRTEVNNQQMPLYFMGVEALEAERSVLSKRRGDDFADPRISQIAKELQLLESNRQIELLKRRKDEDQFLKGISDLRVEQARLRNLHLDLDSLRLVNFDRQAVQPVTPLGPKTWLIGVGGLLLGLILGAGIAVFRYFVAAGYNAARSRQIGLPADVGISAEAGQRLT
ncbi:Wzz/FepE/Etk N-terminal domain-containing protein [Pseudomonas wadenswilerensis]